MDAATSPTGAPAASPVPLVSVGEYHRMGELNENGRRTELLRGVVREKKVKSSIHSYIVRRISKLLEGAIETGYFVRIQNPITMTDSEPEPDVAVIAGEDSDYRFEHPRTALLAVEIPVTTLVGDREKADLYAEAGVPEYWIVIPERGLVEVYTAPRDGLYRERRIFAATDGGTLASTAVPALQLDLATFFASAAQSGAP